MSKSNVTLKNRRTFEKAYGPETYEVVRAIAKGQDSQKIEQLTCLPVSVVAAYRANVTRGTYAPFVNGDLFHGFSGTCNF